MATQFQTIVLLIFYLFIYLFITYTTPLTLNWIGESGVDQSTISYSTLPPFCCLFFLNIIRYNRTNFMVQYLILKIKNDIHFKIIIRDKIQFKIKRLNRFL